MSIFYKRITGSTIQGNAATVTELVGTLVVTNDGALRLHDGATAGGVAVGGGNSLGSFTTYYNALYTSDNSDAYLATFWDSGPGYSSLKLPGDANAPTNSVVLANTKEGGAGVKIVTSNPINGNTEYGWTFGSDGTLTVPGPITSANGVTIATDRGSVRFGANLEVPGLPSHYHINKLTDTFDLFLGDDLNYVKLPGVTYQYGLGFVESETDYLDVAGSSDWNLGDTWTIEFYLNANAASATALGGIWGLLNQVGWSTTDAIVVALSDNKLVYLSRAWNANDDVRYDEPTPNQWTHVAIANDAGTQKVFYNGSEQTRVSGNVGSASYTNGSSPLRIGRLGPANAGTLNGKMALVRISNTAKYTAPFTPTTTYGVEADTKLFLGGNTPLTDTSTSAHPVTNNGVAVVNTTFPLPSSAGVEIGTDGGIGGHHVWQFGTDGKLLLPGGLAQVAVEDGGVRIGTADTNVAPSNHIKVGGSYAFEIFGGPPGYSWKFDGTGRTTFPTTGAPAHSYGAEGDQAGMIAFDSEYIYYCTADYTNMQYPAQTAISDANGVDGGYLVPNSWQLPSVGWIIYYNSQTAVINQVNNGGNPGYYTIFTDTPLFIPANTNFNYGPATAPDIWRRIAWPGQDVW